MCTGGRVKHHLKHNLWRRGSSIVIVGFQAQGTTGRRIVEGAKQVKIFRENIRVRSRVFTIGGFSAHADQGDLMEWVAHFESNPKVFLVHGEPTACKTLAKKIDETFHLSVHIPKWKERLVLKAREVAIERVAEEEPVIDTKGLMLKTVSDLENELKTLRERIKSGEPQKMGEDDLDRLKYIQEELQLMMSEA
jgi:metallo-beta-lactamase family protein